MRGYFLIVICFYLFQPLCAQENIDSLRSVWENADLSDSLRLKAINKLAWDGHIFTQPDSTYYYAQLHFDFAKEKGLKKEMAVALNSQGTAHYMMDNYAKAIEYYYHSLKIKEAINDTLGMAATLNNIGMINDDQGLRKEAIDNYTKAMEFAKSLLKNSNDPNIEESLVSSYNNLGTLYTESDPELALVYFIKMINITSKLGLVREQAYAFNNMGNIYSDRGDKENALAYYQEGLTTLEKIGDQGGIIDGLNNLGILYFEQGDYQKAISYAKKALDKAEKDELNSGISDAAEILYECYKSLGNHQKALRLYELHIQHRDSLKNELSKQELIRQSYKYEYEKRAAADSIAFATNEEIKNSKIAEQQALLDSEQAEHLLLYVVLAMLIVLTIVIYRGNRRQVQAAKVIADQKEEVESQRDKISHQNQLLEEKNREITDFNNNLERLVTERTKELQKSLYQIRKYQHNLAHNIRAPYVTLMGLINLIEDERFDSTENQKVIQALRVTGDKVELVLRDISKELNATESTDKG